MKSSLLFFFPGSEFLFLDRVTLFFLEKVEFQTQQNL